MTNQKYRELTLSVNTDSPNLLIGLENLWELGLISEFQVLEICSSLVCALPSSVVVNDLVADDFVSDPNLVEVLPPRYEDDFVREPVLLGDRGGFFSSLFSELSIQWFLFLGLFLIIISSGVIAASQWQNFTVNFQYGILLFYTVFFGGLSIWCSQKNHLQITAKTLQLGTLLLVPINFWAMDGLNLWDSGWGYLISGGAGIILMGLSYYLLEKNWIKLAHIIGLSGLLWGWSYSIFPLIAIYLGVIATGLVILKEERSPLFFYTLLIILARGILFTTIPISSLGLAIGLSGFLLHQSKPKILYLEFIGWIFLYWSWIITVTDHPSQTLAISGLAIWLLLQRLLRFWGYLDLFLIYIIGIRSIFLCWEILPQEIRLNIILVANYSINQLTLVGQEHLPWVFISLTLFPFLFLMGKTTQKLLQEPNRLLLGKFSLILTIVFWLVLLLISLFHPAVRTIYLISSSLTLVGISWTLFTNYPILVYLNNLLALTTIISGINLVFENLNSSQWGIIFLGLMLLEWGLIITKEVTQPLINSSWLLGLLLALLSYVSFINSWEVLDQGLYSRLWFLTPISLTLLSYRLSDHKKTDAIWLSTISLLLAQAFTLAYYRIFGLAIATVLMWFNTNAIRKILFAHGNILFGLGLIIASLDQWIVIKNEQWLIIWSSIIVGYWLFLKLSHTNLNPSEVLRLYETAINQGGTFLTIAELLILTLSLINTYNQVQLIASIILILGILIKYSITPNKFNFYLVNWSIELTIYGIFLYPYQTTGDLVNILTTILQVGTAIVYLDWIVGSKWNQLLQLNEEVKTVLFHWTLSSLILILVIALEFPNPITIIMMGILLSIYAIVQGRQGKNLWVYIGVLQLLGVLLYLVNQYPLFFEPRKPWLGAIASIVSLLLYFLPWSNWKWDKLPWQKIAMILPLSAIISTALVVNSISLIIGASFYAAIARITSKPRLSYLSIFLLANTIIKTIDDFNLSDPIWNIMIIGLCIIYIAQIDPIIKQERSLRYGLKSIGTAAICIIPFLIDPGWWMLSTSLSIIMIILGLIFKIRAYLYIGTLGFMITTGYQLLVLINENPVFKWFIGFGLGVIILIIGATFETSRNQIGSRLRNWSTELENWE